MDLLPACLEKEPSWGDFSTDYSLQKETKILDLSKVLVVL